MNKHALCYFILFDNKSAFCSSNTSRLFYELIVNGNHRFHRDNKQKRNRVRERIEKSIQTKVKSRESAKRNSVHGKYRLNHEHIVIDSRLCSCSTSFYPIECVFVSYFMCISLWFIESSKSQKSDRLEYRSNNDHMTLISFYERCHEYTNSTIEIDLHILFAVTLRLAINIQ